MHASLLLCVAELALTVLKEFSCSLKYIKENNGNIKTKRSRKKKRERFGWPANLTWQVGMKDGFDFECKLGDTRSTSR